MLPARRADNQLCAISLQLPLRAMISGGVNAVYGVGYLGDAMKGLMHRCGRSLAEPTRQGLARRRQTQAPRLKIVAHGEHIGDGANLLAQVLHSPRFEEIATSHRFVVCGLW